MERQLVESVAALFDGGDQPRTISVDDFRLTDGHLYAVAREPVVDVLCQPCGFAYALFNLDIGRFETPYLSAGALEIVIAKRQGRGLGRTIERDDSERPF